MKRTTTTMRSSRQPMFGTARPSRGASLRKWFRTVVAVGLVLVLLGAVSALLLWRQASSAIDRPGLPAVAARSVDAPVGLANVLVVTTSGPAEDRAVENLALAQFGPLREEPVVVAFPPALKVEVAGRGDHRIDQVAAVGGPDLLVSVVEDYSGLEVDHYVEVSIEGMAELVDRLDGVEVCSGTTCQDLAGAQVAEVLLGGEGDLIDQVRRQHQTLAAVAAEVHGSAKLWKPLTFRRVIGGVGQALRVDDAVGVRSLVGLADGYGSTAATDLDVRVIPSFLSPQTGYVHAYPEETAALLQALRDGGELPDIGTAAPEDLAPEDVRVMVLNGEGSEGLANAVASMLTDAGFVVAGTDNHSSFDVERSFIRTTSADEPRARLLADLLGYEVEVVARLEFTNVHVILVIGSDRAGVDPSNDPSTDGSTGSEVEG